MTAGVLDDDPNGVGARALVHHVRTQPGERELQAVERAEKPPETTARAEIQVVRLVDHCGRNQGDNYYSETCFERSQL